MRYFRFVNAAFLLTVCGILLEVAIFVTVYKILKDTRLRVRRVTQCCNTSIMIFVANKKALVQKTITCLNCD